jgi:hypothetical protein
MGKAKTTEQFKEEMLLVNPNIEIIGEYINSKTKILVMDKSCGHQWNTTVPYSLLNGVGCPICKNIERVKSVTINRTGEINYNKYGSKMTIINYVNAHNIDVEFENGYIVRNRNYREFLKGQTSSPYDKTIHDTGYIGEGKYRSYPNEMPSQAYNTWTHMLERCYSKRTKERNPTYKDVNCNEHWHNFQNFAQWYEENYYEIEGETMQLDKDILHKGNKIYSPNNCVFVPNFINSLFIKNDANRGEYPIGVSFDKKQNKFKAEYKDTFSRKGVYLGSYINSKKAFESYKFHKEKHIKFIADQYKDKIPKKLYDAMYNWVVEITD